MEDAHIIDTQVGQDVCIFGVFDGHGGTIIRERKNNNNLNSFYR